MRAIQIHEYGSTEVLKLDDVPKPVPKAQDVLIEVHAAGINPRDWMIREGKYPFKMILPKMPFILGSDVSGVVVEVGPQVKHFKVGDEVMSMQTTLGGFGGYAEYMAVDEKAVGRKPQKISHEEAAGIPLAGLTAWQALFEHGQLQMGNSVVVVGASGGVGSFAVQIAKAFGAHVTGICSERNLDFVKELGADDVIDYTQTKFTETLTDQNIVFDVFGAENLKSCSNVLKKSGTYVSTVPYKGVVQDIAKSKLKRTFTKNTQSAHMVAVQSRREELNELATLVDLKKMRSYIDTVFTLETVAEAHQQSRTLHTRGKIVLKVR